MLWGKGISSHFTPAVTSYWHTALTRRFNKAKGQRCQTQRLTEASSASFPLWLCHGSTISFPQRCLNESRQQLINTNMPATDVHPDQGNDGRTCWLHLHFVAPSNQLSAERRTLHSSTTPGSMKHEPWTKVPQLQTFNLFRVRCYNYYDHHCIFTPLNKIHTSELIQATHKQSAAAWKRGRSKTIFSTSFRTSDFKCYHKQTSVPLICCSFV